MKPCIFKRNSSNMHLRRALIAEGVIKQTVPPLKVMQKGQVRVFLPSYGVLGLLNVLAVLQMGYGLYAAEKLQLPSMMSRRNRLVILIMVNLVIHFNRESYYKEINN